MTSCTAPRRAYTVPWLLASLAACSSDATPTDALGEPMATEPPAFAIATHIFGSDLAEATTYVLLAEQLDSGVLGLDQGLEIQGRSHIWAPDTSGTFYATNPEELQLTKYVLEADGRFTSVARVSVAAAGVTTLSGESMIFPDPTRAWLFDLSSAQAVEIDLEAMALGRSVDISALVDPLVAAVHALDPARAPAPCMVRLPGARLVHRTRSNSAAIWM